MSSRRGSWLIWVGLGCMALGQGDGQSESPSIDRPANPSISRTDNRSNSPSNSVADSLYATANRLFKRSRYREASQVYEALLTTVEHPDLYYNQGNAYYRQGAIGPAVWAYEKGLRYQPRDADLRFNLALVNAQVKDRIEVPQGFPLVEAYRSLKRNVTLNDFLFWGSLAILGLAGVQAFREMRGRRSRTVRALFAVLVAGIIIIHALALDKYWELSDLQEGVVISAVVEVRSTPFSQPENILFRLHEGTLVEVTQTQPEWVEIILLDGKKGWIPVTSMWEL